ncbi:DUF72 domain-containing protein [Microbacterium sp.]|uniref:DUF72 domain-containing protein n=1 Tax=Microbacterium sp. TaxID=51671 RepID=UPI0028113F33|nr:DUF72 domain-containing protein [Microbacterium sp.]
MTTTRPDPPASAARVRVGTSGWRYVSWRGDFYPVGLPQRRELEYIGRTMSSAELNGSFYSLQRPESYRRWRESVPEGFVFAVKGSRYITHMLRLREPRQALANFLASGVLALGPALGPMLWQLPARQEFDRSLLADFLAALPRTTGEALAIAREHDQRLQGRAWLHVDEERPIRHAIEPRSPSFHDPAFTDLLREQQVALTVADTAGRWPLFDEVTAGFVYVRLHGSTELYHSGYTSQELDDWAERCRRWASGATDGVARDVYVYFDNDAKGHAPHDAVALARLVGDGPVGAP